MYSDSFGSRESRHVVVLGSLDVGKSSLVNMHIGGLLRLRIPSHPIPISYSDYNTVGLEHHPSPWDAIKAHLKRNGSVDLILYYMRRGRLSNEQVTHLRDIWRTY